MIAMQTPTSGMPTGDWQFWVVTIVALLALIAAFRALAPKRKSKSRGVSTSLTIEGDSPRTRRKRKS